MQWCGTFLYQNKKAADGFANCKAEQFTLAELLMNCSNHRGDWEQARVYQQVCEEMMSAFSPGTDKMEFVNRTLSQMENLFAFAEALLISNDLIKRYEQYRETMRALLQDSMDKSLLGVRLYGRRGQLYAYLNRREEAWDSLSRSISFCPEADTGNYHICLSYLLQHTLHFVDRTQYEAYERAYFHLPPDLTDRAAILVYEWGLLAQAQSHPNGQYALLIFVKSLWRLYRRVIPSELLMRIITCDYASAGYAVEAHPFQLIYKYLAFLAADQVKEPKTVNRALMRLQGGFLKLDARQMTVCLITRNGYLQYALQFMPQSVQEAYTLLQKAIQTFGIDQPEIGSYFADALAQGTPEALTSRFTYLYD